MYCVFTGREEEHLYKTCRRWEAGLNVQYCMCVHRPEGDRRRSTCTKSCTRWEARLNVQYCTCVHRPGGGAPVQDLYKMGSGTERAILYVCPQAGGGEKKEHLYKILVIGELGTGKTSIIKRYVHQFFSQHYRATVSLNNNNTARNEKDCW